ncbi:hypothetical protein L249_1747 [Ophiocordyceps polyrhachis-furcata BCC 54312]|uniref:Mitochondrial zinc maintenance protein 1, mitochondrial n=1 Tax=Ophiocordyceps polyrhachis-furcata BCC 54312 TaxID=1330021 RepID=A0A367LNL8_9HYPO|nr:hypothetical protein L249_1747 [Ophiocordyceps polyrhachis-furcata BCC 54312]
MSTRSVYKELLRAARITFKANSRLQGDDHVFAAARIKIRHCFRLEASLEPSSQEAQKARDAAKEVARFLRSNIVQGRRKHPDDDTYALRIHEHTELGDNETIGNTCKL